MHLDQLKQQFSEFAPLLDTFARGMSDIFEYYQHSYTHFQQQLSTGVAKANADESLNKILRQNVFDTSFCERIPEHLRHLRKIAVRVEDHRTHAQGIIAEMTNTLIALIEQLDTLCQKHWEWYRYQAQTHAADLIGLLGEMGAIERQWAQYLSRFSGSSTVIAQLRAVQIPEAAERLLVSYQLPSADSNTSASLYPVEILQQIIDFLNSAYQLLQLVEMGEQTQRPSLHLLEINIDDTLQLALAIPKPHAGGYITFLQRLFLKDVLKQEPLVKTVCDSLWLETKPDSPAPPARLAAQQKQLLMHLKKLPSAGQFQIQTLRFPEDNITVLRDFVALLDQKQISTTKLFGETKKASRANSNSKSLQQKDRSAADAAIEAELASTHSATQPSSAEGEQKSTDLHSDHKPDKRYINLLTEPGRSSSA